MTSFQSLLLRRSKVSNGFLGFHSLTQKSSIAHPNRIPLTKIVATIGPASEQLVSFELYYIITIYCFIKYLYFIATHGASRCCWNEGEIIF